MHSLYGALRVPFVPERVTRGCSGRTQQNLAGQQDFYFISLSLWNDLADPVFDGVGLAGFKSRANDFLLALAACSLFVSYGFLFLFFLPRGWYCGAGVFGLKVCKLFFPALQYQHLWIIIITVFNYLVKIDPQCFNKISTTECCSLVSFIIYCDWVFFRRALTLMQDWFLRCFDS